MGRTGERRMRASGKKPKKPLLRQTVSRKTANVKSRRADVLTEKHPQLGVKIFNGMDTDLSGMVDDKALKRVIFSTPDDDSGTEVTAPALIKGLRKAIDDEVEQIVAQGKNKEEFENKKYKVQNQDGTFGDKNNWKLINETLIADLKDEVNI